MSVILTPQSLIRRIEDEFIPDAYKGIDEFPMLAHYTSADALSKILDSREIWFSNTRDMNDTSEIIVGFESTLDALRNNAARIFGSLRCNPESIIEKFEKNRTTLENCTYAFSLCEHGAKDEADRLDMWRAYGQNGSGVCVVFNKAALLGQSAGGTFPVRWIKMQYETELAFKSRIIDTMERLSRIFLESQNKIAQDAFIIKIAVALLVAGVIGHKDRNFETEKECRFVYSPLMQKVNLPKNMQFKTVIKKDISKNVFSFALEKYSDFDVNAEPKSLINHVIIGPSNNQPEVYNCVRNAFDKHNLLDKPIIRSSIPYRGSTPA